MRLYRNNLKNRGFGKAGATALKQAQPALSESMLKTWSHEEASKMGMPAKSKTDSPGCFGISFRDFHLIRLLKYCEESSLPMDRAISLYFKENHALGSTDRKEISDLAYALVRFRIKLDALSEEPFSWEKRLRLYRSKVDGSHLAPHLAVSFPKILFNKIVDSYGLKEAIALCHASNMRALATVRVNTLKCSREEFIKGFGNAVEAGKFAPNAVIFHQRPHLFSLHEFRNGLFEVQDEGSQLVAEMVKAEPGQWFLDYCCGSGGKSLAVAPKMKGRGQIFIHDIRNSALIEAKKRFKRAGIQNYQRMSGKLQKKMDWVLCDVPCSGSGTFRRNPDMKERFCEEEWVKLRGEQRKIFEQGLSYVKSGGRIVFATCSLLKEENEDQTEHFLKTYPLSLEETMKTSPLMEMDGFYAACFKKLN